MISNEMVEQAAKIAWQANPAHAESGEAWDDALNGFRATYRAETRAVLEYAAALGPTREERLRDYRCAIAARSTGTALDFGFIERSAHAMLAAERPADAAARDESPGALLAFAARDILRAFAAYKGNIEGPGANDLVTAERALRALLPDEKGTDDGQG